MADYVQYHNTENVGPLRKRKGGRCGIVTNKTGLERLDGETIWLISGEGKPRRYSLLCCFTVEDIAIAEAPYSAQLEGPGTRFDPAVRIDDLPTFQQHYLAKKLYSFGLQKIDPELARDFERVRQASAKR